jgi:hypothetical protein
MQVKKARGGKGTYLDAELINSPAFRSLGQKAIHVYFDFRLRMQIHKKTGTATPLSRITVRSCTRISRPRSMEYHDHPFNEPSTS